MLIGYEFEVLTRSSDTKILSQLYKMFGEEGLKFDVVTDCSIRRDKTTKKKDGWQGWEIITPPQRKSDAEDTLREIQSYLSRSGAVTNGSTGFHVNISAKNMTNFDPLTLISMVDETRMAKSFSRTENRFCLPWSYFFDKLNTKIKRKKYLKDKYDAFKESANNLAIMASGCSTDHLYSDDFMMGVYKHLDEKYMTINVSKLIDGYVEFRMMGGKEYHEKELWSIVSELSECVKYAAKGKDDHVIDSYLGQY